MPVVGHWSNIVPASTLPQSIANSQAAAQWYANWMKQQPPPMEAPPADDTPADYQPIMWEPPPPPDTSMSMPPWFTSGVLGQPPAPVAPVVNATPPDWYHPITNSVWPPPPLVPPTQPPAPSHPGPSMTAPPAQPPAPPTPPVQPQTAPTSALTPGSLNWNGALVWNGSGWDSNPTYFANNPAGNPSPPQAGSSPARPTPPGVDPWIAQYDAMQGRPPGQDPPSPASPPPSGGFFNGIGNMLGNLGQSLAGTAGQTLAQNNVAGGPRARSFGQGPRPLSAGLMNTGPITRRARA